MPEIIFDCPNCEKKEVFQIETLSNIWEIAYFLSNNGQPICIDCDEPMNLREYPAEPEKV